MNPTIVFLTEVERAREHGLPWSSVHAASGLRAARCKPGSHGAVAVALLATLLAWGREGLAARIDRCMRIADELAAWIAQRPDLELYAKPSTDRRVAVAAYCREGHRRKTAGRHGLSPHDSRRFVGS